MKNSRGGNYIERAAGLKKIQQAVHAGLRDQQQLNLAAFSKNRHLTEQLSGTIGNEVQFNTYRQVSLLASIFPRNDKLEEFSDVLRQNDTWSKTEVMEIEDRLKVMQNPDAIIGNVFEGREAVTSDQYRLMKEAHPEIVNSVAKQVIAGINNGEMKFPRQTMIRIGRLIDVPTDSSQTGQYQSAVNKIFSGTIKRQMNLQERGKKMMASGIKALQTEDQGSMV